MISKAKDYLKQFGMDDRIIEFEVSSATVELAAKAIGCEPNRIAKSLTFDVMGTPVMIIASGDAKVDNTKFKAQFSTKAKMLPPDEVEAKIGHAVGGVCPFGIRDGVEVYLDESLRRFDYVYPACGSSNSVIKMTLQELNETAQAISYIDVCKNWMNEDE